MNKKIVERKPHYGLRKFSIGVVSVLIGTSMYFGVSSANAMAAEDSPNNAQVATETKKSVEEEKDTAKEDKAANQTEKDTTKESNKEATKQADPAKKTETSGEKPFIDDSELPEHPNKNDRYVKMNSDDISAYRKAAGLEEKDLLSDEQLKAMGLTPETYLHDGVIYRVNAHLTLVFDNGRVLELGSYNAHHKANGDLDAAFVMNYIPLFEDKDGHLATNINDFVSYAPYLDGGTIYIEKGHALDDGDLNAAFNTIEDKYKSGVVDYKWDKDISKVDVNKVGSYKTMIDLTFKNDVTTSAGITVIVREPAPVIPDNPPVVIPDPTPSNPTNPTDNVEPKPEEPAVPETPDNSDENENVQPKAQDNGEVKQHKSAKKTVVNAPVKVASVKSEKALKASLPQTGDSQNQLGLIGLALAAVAGLFGIASERKRKN